MEFNTGTGVVKLFKCFVSSKKKDKGGGEEGFFLWVGWGAGVVLYCFVFLTFILFRKLPLVTRTPGIIIVNLGPKNAEFEIARRAIQKSCNTILGATVLTPLEYRLTCTLYSFIYSLNQCLRTTY